MPSRSPRDALENHRSRYRRACAAVGLTDVNIADIALAASFTQLRQAAISMPSGATVEPQFLDVYIW